MSLPPSFSKDGFISYSAKRKIRRLLIATEGESDTGKTEFMASAPGPGIIICIDRGHEGMLENPKPPKARRDDFLFHPIAIKLESAGKQEDFVEAWAGEKGVKTMFYKALANPDALTVGLDTDNASWDLQLLAMFGKTTQIPQLSKTHPYIQRRAFLSRAFDSGKNVIGTNMLRDEYAAVLDDEGRPTIGSDGKVVTAKTGNRERKGFPDHDYMWQVGLLHMVKKAQPAVPPKILNIRGKEIVTGKGSPATPTEYGIRILKCKMRGELVGEELWGDKCNFAGLVQLIYPGVPLSEWGYK